MKKSAIGMLFFYSVATIGIAAAETTADAVPGEILITFRDQDAFTASQSSSLKQVKQALVQILGADSVHSITPLQMDESIAKVVLKDSTKTEAAISQITTALQAEVKYAEPNYIYSVNDFPANNGAPNDPYFSKQWDMANSGQMDHPEGKNGKSGSDINVLPLWKEGVTGERKLLVAVVDSGIDYTHPDLAANIYKNPGEVPANGIDDDANGVVDDVYGANFSKGAGIGNGRDDNNHGTHCAGTIGAVGNDRNGISGVNWAVSMLPVKFLAASGKGTLEGAVNAIKYTTKMGAKIISNSWGGGAYSEIMKAAIKASGDSGALFIAAAGNNGSDNDANPRYPSGYLLPNVMSVAATDNRDGIAEFSNYGKKTVHVSAPGENILSTVRGGKYDIYSGTSMATPHVSGIAALIWGVNPAWTAAEVKERLINTSTPIRALKKKTVSQGRVNAYNALHNIVTLSDEPKESDWRNVKYALESSHPYGPNLNRFFEISVPGAKFIRVVFQKISTQPQFDHLMIITPAGEVIEKISGTKTGEYISDYVQGSRLRLRLKSDASVSGYGFKIAKIQVVD